MNLREVLTEAEQHEVAVAKFFAVEKAADPDRVRAVRAKFPVLSEKQLLRRRQREIPAFEPGDDTGRARHADPLHHVGITAEALGAAEDQQESEVDRYDRIWASNHATKSGDVVAQLRSLLNDGPRPQTEVAKWMAGVSHRQLADAKKTLSIKSHRVGFGPRSHVVWELPHTVPAEG